MSRTDHGRRSTDRAPNCYDWVPVLVVIGILTMAAFTTAVVMFYDVPQSNAQLVGQIQGSLWLAVGSIIQYYFGRNKGSDQKDATIATQAQAISTAQHLPAPEASGPKVPVAPGEQVVVEGTDDAKTTP